MDSGFKLCWASVWISYIQKLQKQRHWQQKKKTTWTRQKGDEKASKEISILFECMIILHCSCSGAPRALPARPRDRPSAPRGNQCLLSHLLTSLGAQEKTDCTSMLWSIDSCQNRVSADQYHLTVSRAQVSTHQGRALFWSYPQTSYWFWNDRRLKFIFEKNSYEICCVVSLWPRTIKILISN